jgi:hypothetical protein
MLLTGNTETVYGMASLDLKRDGPVVVQAPPAMLGGFSDLWQHQILELGPTGADKGKGGKFLLLPPEYDGYVPDGYLVGRARTYRVLLGVRGFLSDGKPDRAVGLMKTVRIYPLRNASNPPPMVFVNGSQQPVDTLFNDTYESFEDLARIVAEEPEAAIPGLERFRLAQIGIEKFKPFKPNAIRRALLDEAARLASAIARTNSFASNDPERLVYADRMWEWAFIGGSADWDSQGYVNTDRRAAFAYIAVGMSPAMVDKMMGFGSQYLWTPRDASGDFLDGGESYRLHIPANIPAKNFWSVVIYDSESRSLLANGEPFPSVSTYTGPDLNADGSIDLSFGPELGSGSENNWIRTVPDKGWFALFRFYGPLQPFFDKSWKPGDIERVG